jgi:hypothetical protein
MLYLNLDWYNQRSCHAFCFTSLQVTNCLDQHKLLLDQLVMHPSARDARGIDCRFLLLPLNKTASHWSLAIFDRSERVIYVADSLATDNSPLSIQFSTDLPVILDDSRLKVKKLPAARQWDTCSLSCAAAA